MSSNSHLQDQANFVLQSIIYNLFDGEFVSFNETEEPPQITIHMAYPLESNVLVNPVVLKMNRS